MTESTTTPQSAARSPGLKLLLIALLTVAMAIPLFAINLTLSEREGRAFEVATDVANGWGGQQIVAGPIVLVPYTQTDTQIVDGRSVELQSRHMTAIMPGKLRLDATADASERHRGIFDVPVYRSDVSFRAEFGKAELAAAIPSGATPLWNEAVVTTLVSDPRGLADNVTLTANGRTIDFEPGAGIENGSLPGIHASLGVAEPPERLVLHARFALRGVKELSFVPLGRSTTSRLASDWQSPSFFGAFLPGEHHEDAKGFHADWSVPYLARGFAQNFVATDASLTKIQESNFGVRFYKPVDFYQLVERSLKYAVLFVGLGLLTFFVAELVAGRRLHAVQYVLVGAAQVLFYLLLLSFAEHTGFLLAYALAAAATVILTALYARSAFASTLRAAVLGAVMAALYALLYVILNSEDDALLIGSLLLFAALGATMFVTRKTDWYRVVPVAP
jgi:inner membrane protein